VKDLARRAHVMLRRHPAAADAALALVFATAALISLAAVHDQMRHFDPGFHPPGTVAAMLAMLGISLPLAWRRRAPFSVAIAVVGAFLVGRIVVDVAEAAVTILAGSLAIYSAAIHGRRRFRTLVLALCLGAMLAEVAREVFFAASAADLNPLAQTFLLAYTGVVLSLPWVLGAVIRSLRDHERELADRAIELQREREANARQAVFAERVRIARELHDVVAHHVSVMGVQAGAARRVMERQPDKAAAALSSIETSSRQAVLELQRLLAFLRRGDEVDDLAPQPGLAQLDDLVAQAAQGELTVDLSIEGDPRPLSPTLEVSAYRVIQEALTNTRKHSGSANATVRVCYGPATLEVEVLDDGSGPAGRRVAGADSGHGLIGMRERAALHGGHLRTGPRPEGGFGVLATFPLNGSVA
jgi:signal transduction histidine kinase